MISSITHRSLWILVTTLWLSQVQAKAAEPKAAEPKAAEPKAAEPKAAPTPQSTPSAEDCTHTDDEYKCVKYLRNYDGDTVTVNIPHVPKLLGNKMRIRIAGIDTPEIKGKNKCEKDKARAARDLVKSQLRSAQRIDLKNVRRGHYFRIVADLYYDGKNLKEVLIKNGLAVPYDGGKKKQVDWCKL